MSREDEAFEALFAKLERERGFRGSLYRQRCLRRRVAVRMRARGVRRPDEYAALLDGDADEYDRLLRALTINVSKFFRNRETWEALEERVLPELLTRTRPLLFWSAGTAAGEEAYSLAILVRAATGDAGEGSTTGIRILGTDIDRGCLQVARRASYPELALSETPGPVRRRWFDGEGPCRLREPIVSMVEFRQLDILAQPPAFTADLILCRNLLIYLDRDAQRGVFRTFCQVLARDGYLVLGRVETLVPEVRDEFEVVDARERIYRKR